MVIDDETPVSCNTEGVNRVNVQDGPGEAHSCGEPDTNSQVEKAIEPAESKSIVFYRAAGFWVRLLAFVIDLAVIACLNSIIWDAIISPASRDGFIYGMIKKNALFLGLTGAAYFILMTHYYQQTLGKMIAGIKVVQRSGDPLSWTTVIFRELVARSLSQLMGLNLGYVFCWFNADKRCLHDFLSDTWVVYVKPPSHPGFIAVEGEMLSQL